MTAKTKALVWIKGLVKDLLWIGAFVLVFQTLAFGAYHIPSSSMEPTLHIGDRIVVAKFSYGYTRYSMPFAPPLFQGRIAGSLPKRGDIVVFAVPEQDGEVLIKRVVGLPGDRIQMRGGRLIINGQIVPRRLIEQRTKAARGGWPQMVWVYEESLPGGVAHQIAEFGDDFRLDDTPEFTVPEDNLFMMGDNRDNSNDSRMPGGYGFVAKDEVIGHALAISYTIADCDAGGGDGCFLGLPWGRFFNRLH